MAETPQSCESHQQDYKANAWEMYSLTELGNAVAFFAKRAAHRTNLARREKDLVDARNYWHMMGSKLDEETIALRTAQMDDVDDRIRAATKARAKVNVRTLSLDTNIQDELDASQNAKREADLQAIRNDLNAD